MDKLLNLRETVGIKEMVICKEKEAEQMLLKCVGEGGVWASPDRYKWQCWTRDFDIALMDALLDIAENEATPEAERDRILNSIKNHLTTLSASQQESGQISILYLDPSFREEWISEKETEVVKRLSDSAIAPDRKIPFLYRRFKENKNDHPGNELWDLTPGTRDSELHYLRAMYNFAARTKDNSLVEQFGTQLDRALLHIENKLLIKEPNPHHGLMAGADWRDTMEKELADNPLLTNNSWLYELYVSRGETQKAEALKKRIKTVFWENGILRDYPTTDKESIYASNYPFDPLGAALAIEAGLVEQKDFPRLLGLFKSVDVATQVDNQGKITNILLGRGITAVCKHNPVTEEERKVIKATDGRAIWPFIAIKSFFALMKMGEIYPPALSEARIQAKKILGLKGFYEWYDPHTGKGYGAPEQLWGAALFLKMSKQILAE